MIRRLSVDLQADGAGTFAPVAIVPGPCLLLALETAPGDIGLTDRFDVVLASADCPDEACGAGLGRSGSISERHVCRVLGALNRHMTIRPHKTLQMVVTGNRVPGARLVVSLLLAVD